MTRALDFKQRGHLNPVLTDPATAALSAEKLLGTWLNTDPDTQGISELLVEQDGDHFTVSGFGAGPGERIPWPRTHARALANLEEEAGQRAVALTATFEFGFMKAETHIRVNKGVLVIVLFYTFLDGSGRSNYVNREFFYRQL